MRNFTARDCDVGSLYTRFKDLVIFCGQQGKMPPNNICPCTIPSLLSMGGGCDYDEILLL